MDQVIGFQRTGVGYVAQLEYEHMFLHNMAVCSNCLALGFDKSLRRCTGCNLTSYCSKECQKQHWSRHKRFCNLVQGKARKNAYLSGLDNDECFSTLIDSYRLRVDNDHLYRHENHGIYFSGELTKEHVWAEGDVFADFQRYLDLAETSGILPVWWSFEARMECLAVAVDQNNNERVLQPIDQGQLLVRYGGDITIRNALCILAELVVGYDGQGAAKGNSWFYSFQELLDSKPEEKRRLISGTIEAVAAALEAQNADNSESGAT